MDRRNRQPVKHVAIREGEPRHRMVVTDLLYLCWFLGCPCWSRWIRGKQGVLQYSLLLIFRRYKVHLLTLGGGQVFSRILRLPVTPELLSALVEA